MSFIPENTPFIALPTALKGKVTPYQLLFYGFCRAITQTFGLVMQQSPKMPRCPDQVLSGLLHELVELGLTAKTI